MGMDRLRHLGASRSGHPDHGDWGVLFHPLVSATTAVWAAEIERVVAGAESRGRKECGGADDMDDGLGIPVVALATMETRGITTLFCIDGTGGGERRV